MKIITFLMALIIFCFSLNYTFSGTIEPAVSDSKYVDYGKNFDYVVKINCFDGKGVFGGSAVVIDPHWVLTAAHVVESCHSWTVLIGEEKYNLDKIIIYPEYRSDLMGFHDIALGYSSKEMIVSFYPDLYEDEDEVGKVCSISGWGFTGTFETGLYKHDGIRRAGSNFIDKIENKVLICSASKRNQKSTELEYLICSGDSGGGLFIGKKLAGINSSVIGYDGKSNSSYGDESCHTRISFYYNWIKENMLK